MRVAALYRYPVKSMQGERLAEVAVTPRGLEGDRRYAVFDAVSGLGLTARRVPALLFGSATLTETRLHVTAPDGVQGPDDAALSAWLGRPVTLREDSDATPRRYENPDDAEDEAGPWSTFLGAPGGFHDEAPVSLLSGATAGGEDLRRFRPNVVLDTGGEDDFVGRQLQIGGAVLSVDLAIPRCVMVTRAQPGGLPVDRDVLRRIHRERDGCLAVGASVVVPGVISVGDAVLVS